MQYCLATEGKALTLTAAWKNLTNVLTERNQAQGLHVVGFHLHTTRESIETEGMGVVSRAGGGELGLCLCSQSRSLPHQNGKPGPRCQYCAHLQPGTGDFLKENCSISQAGQA